MAESPAVMTDDGISENSEFFILTVSTKYCSQCSEVNKVPISSATSEIVVVTCKMIQWDDKQRELVVGKNMFPLIYFPDAELVVET